ncbi:MAG: hypothetical protein L6R35_003976 [Caloplaca aegaea]|nr:MAG: hypothetical protein L6R35_003976 [Caloplaca aegaea]
MAASRDVVAPPVYPATVDQSSFNVHKQLSLQRLAKHTHPDVLERGVAVGVEILDQLKGLIVPQSDNNVDVEHWTKRIGQWSYTLTLFYVIVLTVIAFPADDLRAGSTKSKIVIGVLGNTGAGKSSLINALLDEQCLVPTNGYRACTAAVTHITYNHKAIPYRAEIEYIDELAWSQELSILLRDLVDDDGNASTEAANLTTDAGVAWAKFKAVYPTLSKEDLAKTASVESLVGEKNVSRLLGQSCEIEDTNAATFYQRLQKLVDSKDRSTGRKKGANTEPKQAAKEPAYWPLIKVVKIYVKSSALKTGLSLVDLPGVGDSNAARSAVAETYMRNATGFWVVAPINRAVDDKTAQSLLGQSFKRQLRLDEGVGSVTFICSKTDHISVRETQESLGLEDKLLPLHGRYEELVRDEEALNTEIQTLIEAKAVFSDVANGFEDELESWQARLQDFQAGQETCASEFKPSPKRKATGLDQPPKRQRTSSDEEDLHNKHEPSDSTTQNNKAGDKCEDDVVTEPPTFEEINSKIAEFHAAKREARKSISGLKEKTKGIRKQVDDIKTELKEINSEIISECISERNIVVKGTIQQDYALGMKYDDQDLAEDDQYDTKVASRDYDEVARALPVFCVSASGYQYLKGRSGKDKAGSQFRNIEDTEIPMLQAHCIKLTEVGRIADSHRFLNSLSQLLSSLAMWASDEDFVSSGTTKEQRATLELRLAKAMVGLRDGLLKTAKGAVTEVQEALTELIFKKHESAAQAAAFEANSTALHWSRPIDKDDRARGGYRWNTYRAICSRYGVKQPHDWNDALAGPMVKRIAPGWEGMFTQHLPSILTGFARRAFEVVKQCHEEIDREARGVPVGNTGLEMLQGQIGGYGTVLETHATDVRRSIRSAQKELNRNYVPVIQAHLRTTYVACASERGHQSFARMKSIMEKAIEQRRFVMFDASVRSVRKQLESMLREQNQSMAIRMEEVSQAIRRDYYAVLVRGNVPNAEELRRCREIMRRGVMKVLGTSDKAFQEILEKTDLDSSNNDVVMRDVT